MIKQTELEQIVKLINQFEEQEPDVEFNLAGRLADKVQELLLEEENMMSLDYDHMWMHFYIVSKL